MNNATFAGQDDRLPPVGAPSIWQLAALVASPLIVIGGVSLVFLIAR